MFSLGWGLRGLTWDGELEKKTGEIARVTGGIYLPESDMIIDPPIVFAELADDKQSEVAKELVRRINQAVGKPTTASQQTESENK